MDAVEEFFLQFGGKDVKDSVFKPNLTSSSNMDFGETLSMPGVQYIRSFNHDSASMFQLVWLCIYTLFLILLLWAFFSPRFQEQFHEDNGHEVRDCCGAVFRILAVLGAGFRLVILYGFHQGSTGSFVEQPALLWHEKVELFLPILITPVMVAFSIYHLDVVWNIAAVEEDEVE
ncbi:hypothetical protein EG329_011238 [Mollisiaceae sp. DMI_Dod_QoI]|nr:hypothetical protein EG329_011238 [Helotiales sp. DMI_Dod_QoI]